MTRCHPARWGWGSHEERFKVGYCGHETPGSGQASEPGENEILTTPGGEGQGEDGPHRTSVNEGQFPEAL